MIVEDPSGSATFKATYLDPMWQYSRPYALIDPKTGRCGSF